MRRPSLRQDGRMPEAVIVAAARTPIGRAAKGSLVDVRPDDLAAFAVARRARARCRSCRTEEIVDVMVGCGFPQEKQGMNLGRRVALLAGLPRHGAGHDRQPLLRVEPADDPHGVPRDQGRRGRRVRRRRASSRSRRSTATRRRDEELHPALFGDDAPIANVYIPMGLTAENVAERWDVSREDMDRFAQRSQERAVAAQDSGFFAREITPYGTGVVARDDGPRRVVDAREARGARAGVQAGRQGDGRQLVPAERRRGGGGRHVGDDARARARASQPRARIIASSVSGRRAGDHGRRPDRGGAQGARRRPGMTIDDVDVMELNEAFAAQVLPVCRELGVDPFGDKLNPHGGAIALGHPYGMTGARIMSTLLNDLETLDGTIGLETMCVGGGQGMAMLVERLR